MNLSLILWLALGSETEANVIKAEYWKNVCIGDCLLSCFWKPFPNHVNKPFWGSVTERRGSGHSSCLTASGLKTQTCKWGQPRPSNSSQAGPEQTNLCNQLRELWEILNVCCFRLLSLGMTSSEKVNWHRSLGQEDGAQGHGNGLAVLWIYGSCSWAPNPNSFTGLFPLVKALLKVYLALTMFQTTY